jgi:DNA-binding response OmpR family regulator
MLRSKNENLVETPNRQRFLLVARDCVFADCVKEVFERYTEFRVVKSHSIEDARIRADTEEFSLIILDVQSYELCSAECSGLGASLDKMVPVMIVVDPEVCPLLAIQVGFGPNEYLMKPVRLGGLVERIKHLLTPDTGSTTGLYEIGPLNFEPLKNIVEHKVTGVSERLTEKEKLILETLYNAKTKSVSRDSLLSQVWGYQVAISTHTLETHVYRLRKKLHRVSEIETILVTTPKGYKVNT